MTTVVWESDNSFENGDMFIVYSGTAALSPLLSGGGERLFSDDRFVYIMGSRIIRLTHGSGIVVASGGGGLSGETNFQETVLTPELIWGRWLLTHYLDDFGDSVGTVTLGTPLAGSGGPTDILTASYPETGVWITQSGYPDKTARDVVGPDYPQSVRVVVALQDETDEHVRVNLVSGFQTLEPHFATNWSPLLAVSGIVTDLEVVRII